MNRRRFNDKAWCCKQLGSPCTAPIYWCCKPVSTNILVLQTFKKSVKFLTLLVMPSQVAPIDWCYEHHSTNILVLPAQVAPKNWCYDVFFAPIYWCFLCWQQQYQPIQICLQRGTVYSFWQIFSLLRIGLIRVERTMNNYRTPCFLHGD